ncbi:AbrB/MazE/SpoVT family DNA-binding domain-containing protein (plasmid) [Paenibacillus rhizovicinus]|uniref:AbrB/MazE/SpoVT family DNA-binding domain-containing protein n=1 Tax=Paenibacillus rhizovicinus TaxID=2704463 RepID=A0A6C0PAK3_9BACL|nr:AbrB/MazE/SpoVT family DNA-binding domain-containing protein [Paenibacillus rhizovicinus]
MRSTGIVRKVDELGRIVLPIELRRVIGVDIGASIEFYEDGRNIWIVNSKSDNLFKGFLAILNSVI